METLADWPLPNPDHFNYDELVEQGRLQEQYCRIFGTPGVGDFMNGAGMLFGMEQVYMAMLSTPYSPKLPIWLRAISSKPMATNWHFTDAFLPQGLWPTVQK